MNSNIIIIGGGVIGLSIGYYLSKNINDIIILESNNKLGAINSSRNTETIHAGIYYKEGSLKSKLSVRGKKLIYKFCKKFNIKHNVCGKIFISQNDHEYENFDKLITQAKKNKVNDLVLLDKKELKKTEPNLNAQNGLLSPSSGVFDSYAFLQTLENLNNLNDVIISKNCIFLSAKYNNGFWNVRVKENHNIYNIKCNTVINCAGLRSIEIAKNTINDINFPLSKPIKGCYLRYKKKSPFNHIIYPSIIPGLIRERTDAVPDINSGLRFGPSIDEALSIEDFTIPENLIDRFYKNIKTYFPKIDKNDLIYDIAGIRPRITIKNDSNPDFYIKEDKPGWINLLGIESPGLTSSLSIGEYVLEKFFKN